MQNNWRERLYQKYVSSGQAGVTDAQISIQSARHYNQLIIKKFLSHFQKGVRIIDVGCGHGAFLYTLKNEGFTNILGVEVSAEQVNIAHQIGLEKEVIESDIFSYLNNHQNDKVNAFFLKDILEHFNRQETFDLLDVLYKQLTNDGLMIIHVPNAMGIFGMTIRYGDLTHEIAFTPKSAVQLLKTIGFSKIVIKEDKPIIHGLFSFIRYCIWQLGTVPFKLLYFAETGSRFAIFSQNMTLIAYK